MDLRFQVSYEKATQALNFMATKDGGRISKLKAIKLIFLADRYHLRKYGRPVVGDQYFAMEHGPVPSVTKDLADKSRYLSDREKEYAERFIETDDDKRLTLSSVEDVDQDVFSDSDIEALNFVWKGYGSLEQWALKNITHAYPEWQVHQAELGAEGCQRTEMEYADFFRDPDPQDPRLSTVGYRDFFSEVIDEEQKESAREIAEEETRICSLWR